MIENQVLSCVKIFDRLSLTMKKAVAEASLKYFFCVNQLRLGRSTKPWYVRSIRQGSELGGDAIILHFHKPNKSQKVKGTITTMYLYCLTVYHAL